MIANTLTSSDITQDVAMKKTNNYFSYIDVVMKWMQHSNIALNRNTGEMEHEAWIKNESLSY